MKYLLDTSALIRWAHRDPAWRDRLHRLLQDGDELGSCDITIAEFYSGVAFGFEPAWDGFIESLSYWPTSRAAAWSAAEYQRNARGDNIRVETPEALIAAVAREQNAVLLTADPKDFQMPGLQVEALP